TGVVGSVLVAAIYGRFSLSMLRDAFEGAMIITAMIMVIVVSSNLFGQLLGFTGATRQLVALGQTLSDQPYLLLAMLLGIVFVLCMFIDQIALMLIIVPIYKPLVDAAGLDPIWFWMLVLLNLAIGGITPPFGYTMFAFKATAAGVSLTQVYRAAWPFVGVYLVLVLLVILFPPISTWLPTVMR
ncbi:MAG: TRAP transporter large permease subunit, partial [Jannaschia sp.]